MSHDDPNTVKLTKPIQALREGGLVTLTSITLREPDGGMLSRAGSYMRLINLDDGNTAIEPIPKGMNKLIAACANLTERSVETMHGRDINAAQGIIMGFLAPLPEPETSSSTDTSSALISGGIPVTSSA